MLFSHLLGDSGRVLRLRMSNVSLSPLVFRAIDRATSTLPVMGRWAQVPPPYLPRLLA